MREALNRIPKKNRSVLPLKRQREEIGNIKHHYGIRWINLALSQNNALCTYTLEDLTSTDVEHPFSFTNNSDRYKRLSTYTAISGP